MWERLARRGSELVTATVMRLAQYPVMPWRNGGGRTREIVRVPTDTDEFDWRVSIADIETSGQFSTFPGIDRVIMLCEPGQLTLSVNDVEHRMAPYQPLRFAGEDDTSCRDGSWPTRDLNVMTRRGTYSSRVTTLASGGYLDVVPTAVMTVVVALHPGMSLLTPTDGTFELSPYDAVLLQPAAVSGSHAAGRAALIDILAAGEPSPGRAAGRASATA